MLTPPGGRAPYRAWRVRRAHKRPRLRGIRRDPEVVVCHRTPTRSSPWKPTMHHDSQQLAAHMNARIPGWLIMWSPYRQAFTAIALCTPYPLVLDDPDPAGLLDQARDAQLQAPAAQQPHHAGHAHGPRIESLCHPAIPVA